MGFFDFFNIVAGSASIIGLIISIVIASKVTRLTNSNNQNNGQIQQGDGKQNVAKDHSVIGNKNIVNDYRGANIRGEIDEFPVLTEQQYVISNYCDKYNFCISNKTSEMIDIGKNDIIIFTADFTNIQSSPDDTRFIGYSFQSLPMRDWRSFITENYNLLFTYNCTGNIKEIWVEITNKTQNLKLYRHKLDLSYDKKEFSLCLKEFFNVIETWKNVDEICFVFFPEDCIGEKGTVYITDLGIYKTLL